MTRKNQICGWISRNRWRGAAGVLAPCLTRFALGFILCAITPIVLPAQTFKTIFSFDDTDGANSNATLVQGRDGNLYGTASAGGTEGYGTMFKITPDGTLTTLYNFCSQSGCLDGENPEAVPVQATNGDFYGTTYHGGANGGCFNGLSCGTVFKITQSGTLTTLYSFCSQSGCADGEWPWAGLIQATDGNLYGTSQFGGAYDTGRVYGGGGTIYKITLSGTLTTLHSFCSRYSSGLCMDGANSMGGLVQAANGDLYGTTYYGGSGSACYQGCGTVFKITTSGTFTTLYSFTGGADGADSNSALVQATDGNFYGTTAQGGANGAGTVFKITPSGTLTTLYSFCSQSGCTDGETPYYERLVQATDGNFYGTTLGGGANGAGTAFKLTSSGTLTTLYSFCAKGSSACTDGSGVPAGVVQDTDGNFYGTTSGGGAYGYGTIFSLSAGLTPFVELKPTSGKVGTVVNILGSLLEGATGVTFNGTPAAFTIESDSLIKTTVPQGATTGEVEVIKSGATVKSNVRFTVIQ